MKVGPIDLIYLFIRLLFEKYENGFASEKVGPIMSIFPSNKSFAENWLLASKPTAEKLFLDFPPINTHIISLSSNWFWWYDRDNT